MCSECSVPHRVFHLQKTNSGSKWAAKLVPQHISENFAKGSLLGENCGRCNPRLKACQSLIKKCLRARRFLLYRNRNTEAEQTAVGYF